ncbi:alanine/ornithine racemase family PLP-dependent enzyme [Acidobacteriota bacterium]
MKTPRLEVDLSKIAFNVRKMVSLYGSRGINIIGVTKGVCGEPKIANVFLKNGISLIGDSRIANFIRMREAGIKAPFVLLRLPCLSEIEAVVEYADISLNTELRIIKEISNIACKKKTKHKVILMVELGDLREGILPSELEATAREVVALQGVQLAGIGTNLACFGGVKPDDNNMKRLSAIAKDIEGIIGEKLDIISCGNTANYYWINSTKDVGKINNVRLGESLLLGGISLDGKGIPGSHKDAFRLVAEVIESIVKPSLPYGEIGLDAFGDVPEFEDRGQIRRVILAIGQQDVRLSGLIPQLDIDILGASSDHLIVDAKQTELKVGDEVEFDVDYGPMLAAMTSPYVWKRFLNE